MYNRSPLEAFLPTEPSETEFLPWLEVKEVSRLAITNRRINTLFKPMLDQHAAKQLLIHVLQANPEKTKAMHTANPRLLFIETTALEWASGFEKETDDPTHRAVQTSPLRAMVATGDQWMLLDAIKTLSNYVDKNTNQSGVSLAAEQIKQQFPNGFDYPKSTYSFESLTKAIVNDESLSDSGHPSATTIELIEKFRKDFIPRIVQTGYLFNLNDLVKALAIYKMLHNDGVTSIGQLRFFWCQVIGYLERLAPTVFAQAISEGLANVLTGMSFKRSMSLDNNVTDKTISYFPLDSDSSCRLGLHFGVDSINLGKMRFGLATKIGNGKNSHFSIDKEIQDFMLSNKNAFEKIYASIAATTKRSPRK